MAAEMGALKGNDAELQQKVALVEELTRQSAELACDTHDAPGAEPSSEPKARKPRTSFGDTAQPSLPVVEQTFEIDDADTTCPSCGGVLPHSCSRAIRRAFRCMGPQVQCHAKRRVSPAWRLRS